MVFLTGFFNLKKSKKIGIKKPPCQSKCHFKHVQHDRVVNLDLVILIIKVIDYLIGRY
jgi:hypothetical protein